ncbi:hypothetical protein BJX99DRAFT_3818 [Aspergillus californicus]
MFWHFIFIALFTIPGVSAEGWEDLANNFAADLAPLVALFGERLTKQFLSESTSLLDNLIFALSPLGILTAVVSVIRICGNSSLRAFVGRANEAPGEAENELLSCVSDGTAECFNNGGISRVFGRPRILELVVWETDPDPLGQKSSYKIGSLRDALNEGAWSIDRVNSQDEKGALLMPELDIPNLSLNKGIKRRGRGWFYLAALLGIVLQGGTFVYSALTVFGYPNKFQQDGKPADSYAFPLFIYGSISLSLGMFLCGYLIERSSSETYFHSAKPSKIYWLQPGRQTIGEQDFGAFLGINEGQKLTYVKSIRGSPKSKKPILYFTLSVTGLGFGLQFVGLRGLHPSVILANVGSMILMAVVRTCLRTKRIGSDGNKFRKEDRELTSHNQQELDCFAFQLEKAESFRLVSSPVHHTARSRSGSCSTGNSSIVSTRSVGLGSRLIQTRARLAELTSCTRHPSMNWDDLPIRKVARDLANTIEMTMEVVSRWKDVPRNTYSFELSYACQALSHKSTGSALQTYPIIISLSDDTFQWRVDANELEAILGLWTFSLLKSNPDWLNGNLGRAVGLTKSEASAEATDLYFHKWIFRLREARMVSAKMISFSEQTFGYYSDQHPDNKEILVVKSESKLEVMAAQDIYIQFLSSIFADLKFLGGDVDMVPRSQNDFFAQSSRVDELVSCFENGNLGSREDALLCIVPILKHRDLLPELAADSSSVRGRVEKFIFEENWDCAFATLQWLCERCEGEEFERSVYELGLLCQRAMLAENANVRGKGFEKVQSLLLHDPRSSFFTRFESLRPLNWMDSHSKRQWWAGFSKQLEWVSWHIAMSKPERQDMGGILKSLRHSEKLELQNIRTGACETKAVSAQNTFLDWVAYGLHDVGPYGQVPNYDEACIDECIHWVIENSQGALCHWLLAKWVEVGSSCPQLAMKAYVFAAKHKSNSAIRTLQRRGNSINVTGNDGSTALIQLVLAEDPEGCKKLLYHGADVNVPAKEVGMTPLFFAAGQGNEEITTLLLDNGAGLEARDIVGFTALQTACKENRLKTAILLLERGGDIKTATNDGRTPLSFAVAEGRVELVRLLLQRGAEIKVRDHYGQTPLDRAIDSGNEEIAAIVTAFDH